MINKELEEKLKELLGKLIDDTLEEDIKKGSNLEELCIKYHNKYLVEKKNYCDYNKHKEKVIAYIKDIQTRYFALIGIYNIINGNFSNCASGIDCKETGIYIEFLIRIKIAKQAYEKGEKIENLTKIIKGETR